MSNIASFSWTIDARSSPAKHDQPQHLDPANLPATRETQAAITARNALHSPLLRLPPELRNKIYHYEAKEGNYRLHRIWAMSQPPQWLGLIRTCRQTYREASVLPYTLNSFSDIHLDSFNKFFVSMKEHCKKVDTVRLQVTMGQAVGWDPESVQPCSLATVLPSVRKVVVYCVEWDDDGFPCLCSWWADPENHKHGLNLIEMTMEKWLEEAVEAGVEVEFVDVDSEVYM